MKVISGLKHFKPLDKKPAVALGVFDGLHLGHQRIIAGLLREAKRLRTVSLVVTFFPHPQKEGSLYSLPHRLKLLAEAGVALCLVIRFSPNFRRITAPEFLQNILIKRINPAVVFIGRNFTFGKGADGDWQMMKKYSKKAKFKLKVIDVLTYKDMPVSSSCIRNLIKAGDFSRAQKLLGRPVSIFGRVTRGRGVGRILGYPTANINPEHEIIPPAGIYAVRVSVGRLFFNGICYIGSRPTFSPVRKKSAGARGLTGGIKKAVPIKTNIEAYIFDFKNNLYGRRIQIEFIKRIRSEKRFSSIQALSRQIKRDIRLCLQ